MCWFLLLSTFCVRISQSTAIMRVLYMLLLRLQNISAAINGNKTYMFCICFHYTLLLECCGYAKKHRRWAMTATAAMAMLHSMLTAQTLTMNCSKKDVKLMKKFISEEIMLNFTAPHKLDLSVHSDINESGDNEKGEIIEG